MQCGSARKPSVLFFYSANAYGMSARIFHEQNTDSTASKILRMIAFNLAMGVSSASCRMNIQPTMSGDQIRLTLSNEHGTSDVKIQAMTVARSNAQNLDRIVASTAVDVTVNGSTEIVIPAGARIVTDPINFPVEALEHISVTMYIDQFSTVNTVGLIGGDSYLYFGDMTTQTAAGLGLYMNYIENSGEYSVIPMLCGVDVYRTDNASACVIIGDSTVANDVPILLEEKLQNTGIDNVSVLQAAIKGNELLNNGQGAIGPGPLHRSYTRLVQGRRRMGGGEWHCCGAQRHYFRSGRSDLPAGDGLDPLSLYTKLSEARHV